jgi:hypothetical protein
MDYDENDYYEDEVDQEDEYSDIDASDKNEDFYTATTKSSATNNNNNNNNNNNTNESSLNYSASSTLTPSAFHNGRDMAKKSRNLSNEDLSYSNNQQHYKHDRLKKICTMALDLQTKLQQTKLKLFGMNPNDETMIYYDKSTSENENPGRDYTSHRAGRLPHQQSQELYKEEVFNSENLLSFEKVFKQQVKEHQEKQHGHHQHQQSEHAYMDAQKYGFNNRSHSPLPGTVDLRARSGRVNKEQAAIKIQRAWRAFAARRHSRHQPRYYRYEAQKNVDSRSNSNHAIQKHIHDLKVKQGK